LFSLLSLLLFLLFLLRPTRRDQLSKLCSTAGKPCSVSGRVAIYRNLVLLALRESLDEAEEREEEDQEWGL
jgi:hypothetical protein